MQLSSQDGCAGEKRRREAQDALLKHMTSELRRNLAAMRGGQEDAASNPERRGKRARKQRGRAKAHTGIETPGVGNQGCKRQISAPA